MPAILTGRETKENLMLRQVWDFDWEQSTAGSIESWPECLRCLARTVLLSPTPMGVLVGRDGLVLFNDALRECLGSTADTLLGRPIEGAMSGASGFFGQMMERIFEGRSARFRDLPARLSRNGSRERVWFDLDFTPIIGGSGQIHGALVTVIETTDRVRALVELKASRERMDMALKASGIVGTWEVDFTSETVRSDARYARLHGVDPDIAAEGADKDIFIAGIHPDDRPRVMKDFEAAKVSGHYRCLHRVVGAEGVRWIVTSGQVQYLPDDNPVSFSGVVVDVTAQVDAAEDALRQSERRFELAFRLSPVPTILSVRSDLQVLDVNDAFVRTLGYDRDSVVGRAGHEIPIWASSASRRQFEIKIRDNESIRDFEMQLRSQDGAVLDCLISAETLRIREQDCVLTAFQDFTDRKQTEEELFSAIEAVMKDTSWFSRSVIEQLARMRNRGDGKDLARDMSSLTKREREILGMMCRGLTDAEIVSTLGLSRNTVRNHVARIYGKVDVHSRSAAIVWARERGFMGEPPRQEPRGT